MAEDNRVRFLLTELGLAEYVDKFEGMFIIVLVNIFFSCLVDSL
jgi:hypothetical protein